MADVPLYVNEDSNLADVQKVFITNFEITGLGTTETAAVLFRNPTGSGKLVKLYRLTMSNLHTVDSFIRVRAYGAPTVTSDGTGLTESCTYFGGAAGSAEAFASPTVSSNGTRLAQWVVPSFSNALIIPLDYQIILPANTTILLTAQADGTSRILGGSLIWAEV